MGGGAVGGAVLGTMILPGIGTVIGGFLGALAGAASTPSFDTQRERIWQSLQPQLTKHFDEIASESRRNLRRLDGKWSSALDQYLARYGDRYRADVKKITDEHEKSLKEVQALEARARQDIEELARRKTALQITAQLLQA
jgi:gas vesicle protein